MMEPQSLFSGEYAKIAQDLLQFLQQPSEVQGDPVQEVSGVQAGSGKKEVDKSKK